MRLLVARLVIAEIGGVLLEGLPDARDIAMPEDAPHAGEEGVLRAIAFDMLAGEVTDEGLRHGEAGGFHVGVLSRAGFRMMRKGLLFRSQLRMR